MTRKKAVIDKLRNTFQIKVIKICSRFSKTNKLIHMQTTAQNTVFTATVTVFTATITVFTAIITVFIAPATVFTLIQKATK